MTRALFSDSFQLMIHLFLPVGSRPVSRACLFLSAIIATTLSYSTATAQATATIHPSPLTLEVGAGFVANLSIVIEDVQNLYGVEVQAHFDPSVVQVVDANPLQNGVQLIPGAFPAPDFLVRNTADNQLGTLEYVVTQTSPTAPVNGTGTLVTIQFRGLVAGQSTPFVIDHVKFSDRYGQTIPVTPQNGVIDVVVPKFVYYFPVITRNK